MADGQFIAKHKPLIAPGVYLDLPMEDYVDDPAISGSGLKKLLLSPADFKWELPKRNPLFTPPESDARALGTLVHAGVLEGMEVFHDRYFVAPEFDDDDPRLIRTADHAKNWLKDHGAKSSGLKAELFDRCREIADGLRQDGAAEDELPIFIDDVLEQLSKQGNGAREQIKAKAMQYVETVVRTVRAYPQADRMLRGGLAEVSIFWVEDGVRFKARLDYLRGWAEGQSADNQRPTYGPDPFNGPLVADLKKFGNIPQRGRDLPEQLQQDAVFYCYDIQAVHNHRAALQIPLLLREARDRGTIISASGPGATERLDLLTRIAAEIEATAPTFHWLWVRTPGPPQVLAMDFPVECKRFDHARWEVDQVALENLRAYRKRCGDELDPETTWIAAGQVSWDDDLLREYQWQPQR